MNEMITLYDCPRKGVNTLTTLDGYWETKNEKEYVAVTNEWKLLKENCVARYVKLNGAFTGYQSMLFYDFVIGFRICVSKREAFYNMQVSIENMKKYLGVWKK